jgi:hypothetical protein
LNIANTVQRVNAVWLSAYGICAFPKDQQTLHACAPMWLQHCSGSICKRNLFCGYASYKLQSVTHCTHIWFLLVETPPPFLFFV